MPDFTSVTWDRCGGNGTGGEITPLLIPNWSPGTTAIDLYKGKTLRLYTASYLRPDGTYGGHVVQMTG